MGCEAYNLCVYLFKGKKRQLPPPALGESFGRRHIKREPQVLERSRVEGDYKPRLKMNGEWSMAKFGTLSLQHCYNGAVIVKQESVTAVTFIAVTFDDGASTSGSLSRLRIPGIFGNPRDMGAVKKCPCLSDSRIFRETAIDLSHQASVFVLHTV